MQSSPTFIILGLLNVMAGALDIRVVRSEHALVDSVYSSEGPPASESMASRQQTPWGSSHLQRHWQQWIRRQDQSSTDSKVSADATETEAQKTSATQTTNNEATTTADALSTTAEAFTSATAESTTEESALSSTGSFTSISTGTSSDLSSTTGISTTTDPGASCYSTTTKTSTICATTGDTTASCTTTEITSSTCSPGLLCATQTSSGTTVCMEAQNDIGTAGVVIACVFSGAIFACVCTIISMCYAEKRKQRKQEELRLARTLKMAERAHLMEEPR